MNCSRFFAPLALVVVLCCTSAAEAAFTWLIEPGPHDRVQLKFENYEFVRDYVNTSEGETVDDGDIGVPDSSGDELMGIFEVTQIVSVGATNINYWNNSSSPGELTGYFYGYKSSAAFGVGLNTFTGGEMKMFYDEGGVAFDADYAVTTGLNPVGHGKGYADGSLFLDLTAVGGVVLGDLTKTLSSTFIPTGSGFTGLGVGYFDIDRTAGGIADSFFIHDAMDPQGAGSTLGVQDLKFQSNVDIPGTTPGWPATSHDPIIGEYVPEPTSLAVWGLLALAGLVFRGRRR